MTAGIIKKILYLSILIFFVSLCESWSGDAPKHENKNKDIKEEVQEAAESIKQYSADQRDKAVKKAKDGLDDLDKKIDGLEEKIDRKWDQMDQTARRKSRETLKELREKRKKTAEWYGGLKHSSKEAWEETKKGFSDSYTRLQDAWKKAVKDFGK